VVSQPNQCFGWDVLISHRFQFCYERWGHRVISQSNQLIDRERFVSNILKRPDKGPVDFVIVQSNKLVNGQTFVARCFYLLNVG
jgi:hypothetical protein